MFKVRIFKNNAVECTYPTTDVEEFVKNKDSEDWNHEEYVLGMSTVETEKCSSVWALNAFYNIGDYSKMKVPGFDVTDYNCKMVCFTLTYLWF